MHACHMLVNRGKNIPVPLLAVYHDKNALFILYHDGIGDSPTMSLMDLGIAIKCIRMMP